MSKSPHLKLHDTDSEPFGVLDSLSLPSEPPDVRNWFSSYTYESPVMDELGDFEDSDEAGETCIDEYNKRKSRNNHPVGEHDDACDGKVKSPPRKIESNGFEDCECCTSAAIVSGSSESLTFSAEPPDIRNWFSSYKYESPQLDTALDFAVFACNEREDGKLYVEENSGTRNKKNARTIMDVEETDLCIVKNTSDAVAKDPDMVIYHSVCKDSDDDNDVTLQSLPSISTLSYSDRISEQMLPGHEAGSSNHKSLEKIESTTPHGNDYDSKLQSTFSRRNLVSLNNENNIGSQDGESVPWSLEGTKDVFKVVSPRTIDRIVPISQAVGRSIGNENKESDMLDDGFISIRKKRCQTNAENVARSRNGVEPMINNKNNVVRKVLSEISNINSQNIMGSTGKWCCPQKNKPDLGPPLKQLRLDQWVRRI